MSTLEAHDLLCEKLEVNYKSKDLRSRLLHPHDSSVRQVDVPEFDAGSEAEDDVDVSRVFEKNRGRSHSSPSTSRTGHAKASDKSSGTLLCSHCKRSGHTDDRCYLKHPHLIPEAWFEKNWFCRKCKQPSHGSEPCKFRSSGAYRGVSSSAPPLGKGAGKSTPSPGKGKGKGTPSPGKGKGKGTGKGKGKGKGLAVRAVEEEFEEQWDESEWWEEEASEHVDH